MKKSEIQQFLETLPNLPGVYKYYDHSGKLIYVGKAKDLRKRVTSYFVKTHENQKTRNLVKNIHRIEFTVVDTERDAFLLEDSLIKNFRPRYNINLKDDKSYPYIVIKNEPFPRVFLTHKVIMDGSEYFGPFTQVGKIRELLELVRSIIPLRKNHLDLFLRITKKGKLKVSPENYMIDSRGKDEKIITEADYAQGLERVRNILKGKLTSVVAHFRSQMKNYVREMEFEKAEILLRKLEFMQEYKASSIVINAKVGDLDVFTIATKDTKAFINYLQVRKGAIIQTETVLLERGLDKTKNEIFISAISHIRKGLKNSAGELVVPFYIDYPDTTVRITIPQKGNKKRLLDLSLKNLNYSDDNVNNKKGEKIDGIDL